MKKRKFIQRKPQYSYSHIITTEEKSSLSIWERITIVILLLSLLIVCIWTVSQTIDTIGSNSCVLTRTERSQWFNWPEASTPELEFQKKYEYKVDLFDQDHVCSEPEIRVRIKIRSGK